MLEMYLFVEEKSKMCNLIGRITEAMAKDEKKSAYVGRSKLMLLDRNQMNHVDKLDPAISWRRDYNLYEWFSQNVLIKSTAPVMGNACYVNKKQLKALVRWCDQMCRDLCLLDENVVPICREMRETKAKILDILDTTNFDTTDVLYVSYWN